jgi:LacI family transcriptional regulator
MARKSGTSKSLRGSNPSSSRPISLKGLAAHLGLSPATLSLVLNDSPVAKSIPQETRERILKAARTFNYRPNFIARSLRAQRTFTVGVLVPEMSEGYSAEVLSGIEDHLLEEDYFYFVASHRHKPELIDRYPQLFRDRLVEGMIAVDTPQQRHYPLPVVAVSGHNDVKGLTNIVLNHPQAAMLALEHLAERGHQQIAVIKGQEFSSDTEVRWLSIRDTARQLGIEIHPQLVAQLEGVSPSPEPGYLAAQKLLSTGRPFTALFSFNDISAIGAIRAFREAGLAVPEDISIIGFDDIHAAAFHNPGLTTIRQPLWQMGWLAAQHLLRRISQGNETAFPEMVTVEPTLIIRQSTTIARKLS